MKSVRYNLLCEILKFPQTESAAKVHLVEIQIQSFRVDTRQPVRSRLYLHPKSSFIRTASSGLV